MAFGGYYQKAEDEQCGPSGKVEPEERKSEGGVGTRAGEREPGVYFPASALWTGACWMMGLKSLLI